MSLKRGREMSVRDTIDSLVEKANNTIPQKTRRRKVRIYSAGLKAKIKQAEFALQKLCEYEDKTDDTITSTGQDEFSITEQVEFYCDTFWTFLYSSLDVLAQIVNQALNFKLDERKVSFRKVESKLRSTHIGRPIQKRFTDCIGSNTFKNLDKYRNCSTHRRQIYIKEAIHLEKDTAAYKSSTAGPVVTVVRTLCDDPIVLTPKIDRKRTIPQYLIGTRDKILRYIELILKETKPV